MDLLVLKKKLDGFRLANGSIRKVSPEVLWELRQTWEHFKGPSKEFSAQLGIRSGTLGNLIKAAKRLNHVMASAASLNLQEDVGPEGPGAIKPNLSQVEFIYENGQKVIRFPDVDTLLDFLRKAA